MEENLPNSFMGYFLELPSFLSFQRFNINYSQRLRFSQVVNLNSPFQPLGLGLGLGVNVSFN
jgi:hypothetical protein